MANTKVKLLDSTIAIPTGAIATTQTASDNTTKVATTAYVTTALANLADSAPSTLNTLNELAAALGDDASFSTTVTNSIATKLPLAGGTMTGNIVMGDDTSIGISDSAERIEFDGAGDISFLGANVGIGDTSPQDYLEINGSGSGIGGLTISNSTHNHAALSFARSAVATARIYTSEPGATHTSSIHFQTGIASGPALVTAMTIDENQRVGIGLTTPSYVLHTKSSDSINTWLQSTHATDCKLQFSSATTDDYSRISAIAGVFKYEADIAAASGSSGHQWLVDGSERMRIDSSGRVLVGQTSSSSPGNVGKLQVTGNIGLTGNSEVRQSTTSNGSTLKFFGTQFVAGQSNSHSYGYSEGGLLASLATAGSAIVLDVGNTTADTGHRFRVINAGNGVDGSMQYIDGTTVRFHVDSSTGIIKENDIPVRSRAIAMAMVFG